MLNALFKIAPILLLFLLGNILGRRQFFRPATLQDLKKLVINITLPSALLLAFLRVELETRLLIIPLVIFSACLLALLVFRLAGRRVMATAYFPYLMTGFEAGMLGYAIYGAVYGAENLYRFGLVDLGQVVFVFFVLIPSLQWMEKKLQPAGSAPSSSSAFREALWSFVKNPVILAIACGIVLNRLGIYAAVTEQPWAAALTGTLGLLAALTTPLVALVIGAELHFTGARLDRPAVTGVMRLLAWIPAALLFNALIIIRLLHLDPLYQAAVMTMAILPAPFVVPLYMEAASEEERAYVVNTLSLQTLLALIAFTAVTLVYPAG